MSFLSLVNVIIMRVFFVIVIMRVYTLNLHYCKRSSLYSDPVGVSMGSVSGSHNNMGASNRRINVSSKMALPGTLLVRLRAVCNLGKYVERRSKAHLNITDVRWYKTNPRSLQDSTPPVKQGECHGHRSSKPGSQEPILKGTHRYKTSMFSL